MKVTLLPNYTPQALETLIFTKQTRLQMSPAGFQEIVDWPWEKKMAELEYMRHTIQSQFEFVNYMFVIEDVTRAFTHQFVRHRVGVGFAQQAQRVVKMAKFKYVTGESIQKTPERVAIYQNGMEQIQLHYDHLLEAGANPQDARGLLPTNVCTNITWIVNLRALSESLKKRLCVKAQGEYQDVMRLCVDAVLAVHPWCEKFLRVHCATFGTCCFHSFPAAECPVKPLVYDPETRQSYGGGTPASLDTIFRVWKENRAEAQPTGKMPVINTLVSSCPRCGSTDIQVKLSGCNEGTGQGYDIWHLQ